MRISLTAWTSAIVLTIIRMESRKGGKLPSNSESNALQQGFRGVSASHFYAPLLHENSIIKKHRLPWTTVFQWPCVISSSTEAYVQGELPDSIQAHSFNSSLNSLSTSNPSDPNRADEDENELKGCIIGRRLWAAWRKTMSCVVNSAGPSNGRDSKPEFGSGEAFQIQIDFDTFVRHNSVIIMTCFPKKFSAALNVRHNYSLSSSWFLLLLLMMNKRVVKATKKAHHQECLSWSWRGRLSFHW